MPPVRPTLHTIPISHYGERARWALDHAGVDYDERHHLQLFAWGAALPRSGRKTVPVVVLPDGAVLADSAEVVRWASTKAPLYPDDPARRAEVEALERSLAGPFAVATRQIVYDWVFRSMAACLPYNDGRAPAWQTGAARMCRPAVRVFARWYLDVHPDAVARAQGTVDRTLDAVAVQLSDGRPYLFGADFTAADLTFATMAAPAVLPERYGVPLPPLDLVPADAAARIRALREHPAGRFVLRLYEGRPAVRARYARAHRLPGPSGSVG